jgi:mannose-6-phosphate isomerase-like protein (cupin superfamily)
MTFALWDISADALPLHEHHHVQEEVWNVVSGAIAITIDGVEHIVDDRSAVTVPSDAPHSARPLGACRVVIADYPRRLQLPGVS